MDQPGGGLHTEDLVWARELAKGAAPALDRYERELVPLIAAQLRRRGYPPDVVGEVQQVLRVRLFVDEAIARYEGRAALRSWVLIAALREAARQRSAREVPTTDDDLVERISRTDLDSGDKARYAAEFQDAFRTAIKALSVRERLLLRMHILDALTIDQIAGVQGVHRATVARWLERARETLSRTTRKEFMARIGTDPFEAEEIMRWVHSRIELSFGMLES
ncbi:MAG TPA: sigma-70 family RNA polymerase sigma factor [Kofleriaceae bacterium]